MNILDIFWKGPSERPVLKSNRTMAELASQFNNFNKYFLIRISLKVLVLLRLLNKTVNFLYIYVRSLKVVLEHSIK